MAHQQRPLFGILVGYAGHDGTLSVVQPMIDPLYSGKTAHEIIQSLLDEPNLSGYQVVRKYMAARGKRAEIRTLPGERCSTTDSFSAAPLSPRRFPPK